MADPDAEFLKNPKFRAFQDEMVKELVSFDRVKEWADIIKCLKRVQKVSTARSIRSLACRWWL